MTRGGPFSSKKTRICPSSSVSPSVVSRTTSALPAADHAFGVGAAPTPGADHGALYRPDRHDYLRPCAERRTIFVISSSLNEFFVGRQVAGSAGLRSWRRDARQVRLWAGRAAF